MSDKGHSWFQCHLSSGDCPIRFSFLPGNHSGRFPRRHTSFLTARSQSLRFASWEGNADADVR